MTLRYHTSPNSFNSAVVGSSLITKRPNEYPQATEGQFDHVTATPLGAVFAMACGARLLVWSVRGPHVEAAAARPVADAAIGWARKLLDGYGLGEVAGLVHVAASSNGNVIRDELRRNRV